MSAITHSVTIPSEQEQFLIDNPDQSLSKILQGAIAEIMENLKISEKTLKEANRKLEVWKVLSGKQRDFIEKNHLLDDYIKENA
jgi:hypothetical protein